jgi:hypothetical protein
VLGVRLEVVEGPTRSINVSFIEVHGFSRRQSCICAQCVLRPVLACALCALCVLPLVNLRTLIFDPSI